MDSRYTQLAQLFVRYSIDVQPGEVVILEWGTEVPDEMMIALIQEIRGRNGQPLLWPKAPETVDREFLLNTDASTISIARDAALLQLERAHAYIGMRGLQSAYALADVPDSQMRAWRKGFIQPVHIDVRAQKKKWVITTWPTPSMAQLAEMSTSAMMDFFFRSCLDVRYDALGRAMEPLIARLQATDHVEITGPGTDVTFSIKGIPAIPCAGTYNVPDGEVFTAPVRESVNGVITFNTATIYESRTFKGIRLEFRDGKIVAASCAQGDERALQAILDTDDGSRFLGEFGIGVNPMIRSEIRNTLFDEKIGGSIHLAVGACYDRTPNGNKSSVHWDNVLCQDSEHGGGQILFDDVLVRENGQFVLPELACLNPENLLAAVATT